MKKDLISYIEMLEDVNKKIFLLNKEKQELELEIFAALNHGEEHSKTYVCDTHKVTITTGYNYTLNKKVYEKISEQMLPEFNPVQIVESYKIDKKVIQDTIKFGAAKDKQLISELITQTPKKLHIKLGSV